MILPRRKATLNHVRNDIGHFGNLLGTIVEDQKVLFGYIAAMHQNLEHWQEGKYDLWDFEFKVWSQWGEDGILNHICNVLDLPKPNCIEIGAGNFKECNTRFLADYRNSKVYLVDINTDLASNTAAIDLNWKTHLKIDNTLVTKANINKI